MAERKEIVVVLIHIYSHLLEDAREELSSKPLSKCRCKDGGELVLLGLVVHQLDFFLLT